MSIQKWIKLTICACIPVIVTVCVWTVYLEEPIPEGGYTGHTASPPTVSYSELMRWFSTAHKPYSPDGGDMVEKEEMRIHPSYSKLSQELNTYIYDVCQQYAGNLFCNGVQLSPLLPLATANMESGLVNRGQTFSSIASTGVYTFESVEELQAFNVTRVLDSEDTWLRMTSDYWTRDRGPLQCLPGYGADDPAYGPSEKTLLDAYVQEHGLPPYRANRDTMGNTFTVQDWIAYARTKFGDRYNVASVIQIFMDEKARTEIPLIERHFPDTKNEYHIYAVMAYNHWIGTGFMTMDQDAPYAGFRTIGRAYEYCEAISSERAIEIIYAQCLQDIQAARERGVYPPANLDRTAGTRLFQLLVQEGVCQEWGYYFRHLKTNGWDQGSVACTYALGVIYGVMQMNLLYSGY